MPSDDGNRFAPGASIQGWSSAWAVIISLSARIGPFSGPIQAFSAIFARTGPRFGPIRALKVDLDIHEKSISVSIPMQNPGNHPRLPGFVVGR